MCVYLSSRLFWRISWLTNHCINPEYAYWCKYESIHEGSQEKTAFNIQGQITQIAI